MPVPVSLAAVDGSLDLAKKSILADVLTKDLDIPHSVLLHGTTALMVDGQALMMALGKPQDVTTLAGYTDVCCEVCTDYGCWI